MNNKTLIGGIVGGIVYFFLGWLFYGMLLADFTTSNFNQCAALPMDSMIWWALIASNFIWGFFSAVIFEWTNTSSPMAGAQKGAIIGIMTGLAFDLGMYSMTTIYSNMTALIVDVATMTLMSAIVGAVIGYIRGMKKTEA